MPFVIPDEALREAGLNPHEALVEFACRLFDADKLTLPSAVRLAAMSRVAFEKSCCRGKSRSIGRHSKTLKMTWKCSKQYDSAFG